MMKKSLKKFFSILFLTAILAPNTAEAAISFVSPACEWSRDGVGDMTLTLPTTLVNDLVIISFAIADNDDLDFNMDAAAFLTGNGYTEVTDVFANDDFDINLGVYWKVMGATPDTEVLIDGQGGNDASVVAVCMAFRGVDTTTPMDVTPVGGATTNTMDPNPGPINHNNPSGVWTVIVGASGYTGGDGAQTYTFPTGYTENAIDRDHNDTTDGTVGMGYRSSGVSDPEDPGAMAHSVADNVAFASATTTIALRPQTTTAPSVDTNAESNVNVSSATLNGNISAVNGDNPSTRGFAWGTSSTLTGADTATTSNTFGGPFGTGTWSETIFTLKAGITYYFRAYATNSAGTGYGSIDNGFTTGTDTTTVRKVRLFGSNIKLLNGKIILHQQ